MKSKHLLSLPVSAPRLASKVCNFLEGLSISVKSCHKYSSGMASFESDYKVAMWLVLKSRINGNNYYGYNGGDLQPGCLADRLLTGLGQPQINP